MLKDFSNRNEKVVYGRGNTYDLPDGYAEFLKRNGFAEDTVDENK